MPWEWAGAGVSDHIIWTNVKIFGFPHSTCRIIGQHVLCGKENLTVSEYKYGVTQLSVFGMVFSRVVSPAKYIPFPSLILCVVVQEEPGTCLACPKSSLIFI